MRAVLSDNAVTMRDPSGLKAAEFTKSSWPRRTTISLPLAASQMRAVLSDDAVTMRDPSGLKAAELTSLSWPRRTAISLALAASQMRAVLSDDAVTMRDPSGLKAAEVTPFSWPRRTTISLALAASQMRAVLSPDAVTMREPSGLKAADNTKLSWPASAAAAGEVLVLSVGNASSMRVPRDANLRALSNSLRDSVAEESSLRMLAFACSSATCRLSSDSFNAARFWALSACNHPTMPPAMRMTAATAAKAQRATRCRRAVRSWPALIWATRASSRARAFSLSLRSA